MKKYILTLILSLITSIICANTFVYKGDVYLNGVLMEFPYYIYLNGIPTYDCYRGTLTSTNPLDTQFEAITTGDSYAISTVTNADPPVVTFAGGSELITASNNRDFTTWGSVNWAGFSGGTIADGTGKLQCTMDASGDCGTYLDNPYMGVSSATDKWYLITADVWQGTTTKTSVRISFGNSANYKTITINGVQTTYTVRIKADIASPVLRFVIPSSDTGTFFIDDISVKLLHDYNTTDNSVVVIGGIPAGEGVGSELVTEWDMEDDPTNNWANTNTTDAIEAVEVYAGAQSIKFTLTAIYGSAFQNTYVSEYNAGDWFKLDAWVKNTSSSVKVILYDVTNSATIKYIDFTNYSSFTNVKQYFQLPSGCTTVRVTFQGLSSGMVFYVDNVSLKHIPNTQGTPFRVTAIDANGACTLGYEDFSTLAANITGGYASSASLTYWTEGTKWRAGTTVDPTPINTNSEFDQWTYSAELVTGTDNADFAGSVGNWVGSSGGTVAHSTNKLEITLDTGNGVSGAQLGSSYITGDSDAGKCFKIQLDIWQGTTTDTVLRINLGTYPNYEQVTFDGVQTTYTVIVNSNSANPSLSLYVDDADGGTLFIDNVSIKQITPTGYTVYGLSATNYLVYDTSANTIRFKSDGTSLGLRSNADTASTNYFYEVGITDATAYKIYIFPGTGGTNVTFMESTETGNFQGFFKTGTTNCGLYRYSGASCDVTASYFRLYKLTDTYAYKDATGVSNLTTTEATATQNLGYSVTVDIDEISAGGLTAYMGYKAGTLRTTSAETTENIKGLGTGQPIYVEGSSASTGVKLNKFQIQSYQ